VASSRPIGTSAGALPGKIVTRKIQPDGNGIGSNYWRRNRMVYAVINWIEHSGEDVEQLHLLVLDVLTQCSCDRQFSPFRENPRYILARLPSGSKLDCLILRLSKLALTFMVTISRHGEPFGCSAAPHIDRKKCMEVTG
jgi:hypothetical protein